MAKKQGETNFYLLSIVAIVAIVGIVVLILQGSSVGTVSSEDVTGEAFKVSSSNLKVPSTETSATLGYGNKGCPNGCPEGTYCVDKQCVDNT